MDRKEEKWKSKENCSKDQRTNDETQMFQMSKVQSDIQTAAHLLFARNQTTECE